MYEREIFLHFAQVIGPRVDLLLMKGQGLCCYPGQLLKRFTFLQNVVMVF